MRVNADLGEHREDFWGASNSLYLDLGDGLQGYVHFTKTWKKKLHKNWVSTKIYAVHCTYSIYIYIVKEPLKLKNKCWGFPGGSVEKKSGCQCRR